MLKRLAVIAVLLLIWTLLVGCGGSDSTSAYILIVGIDGEGMVIPSQGSHKYREDTVVTLQATPAEGWQFQEWDGAVADTGSAETTIQMDGDQTVKALFVMIETDTYSDVMVEINRPVRSSYTFEGEGFKAQAEGWNCTGLVGQWQWRYQLDLLGYGTISGSGTSIIPPQPETGSWLTPPYSYTISGTLDTEDGIFEISYIFEEMVNEIIVLDNKMIMVDTHSGTGKAIVKVILPGSSFVLSDTIFDVTSAAAGMIIFERHPECD